MKVIEKIKMKRKNNKNFYGCAFLFGLVFLFLTSCNDSKNMFSPDEKSNNNTDFKNIEVILEYFADSETVKGHFVVNPGFELGDLVIENPDNNVILDFFSDEIKIHPNYLEFSTSQTTLSEFKESFPKGEYKFSSWRAVNFQTKSIYNLSFEFSDPPEILYPPSRYLLSDNEDLILKWRGFENTKSYIVRIFENGMLIYFSRLKNTKNEILLPSYYFKNNKEYRVRLSAVNNFGNMATRSLSFNTEKEKLLKIN